MAYRPKWHLRQRREPIDRGYVSPDRYEKNRDYYDHNTIQT